MKTPLSYYGGKQTLASRILELIPPHRPLAEPFSGGAAVFFAKVEIINDTNGELINFYEVLKTDFPALEKEIAISLHSRRQFVHAKVIYENPEMFDRVKRAWAVWMTANSSYGCPPDSSFGYNRTGSTGMKLDNKRKAFTIDCAIRPQRTQIECCDALRVIRSRDVPDAFFCLDPPYAGSDRGYHGGCSQEDFDALLELLETVRGKFLPSRFRSKSLAEFSKRNGWETVEYSLPLTMTHGAKIVKRKVEVLTANYPIREKAPASGRKAM